MWGYLVTHRIYDNTIITMITKSNINVLDDRIDQLSEIMMIY